MSVSYHYNYYYYYHLQASSAYLKLPISSNICKGYLMLWENYTHKPSEKKATYKIICLSVCNLRSK